MGNRQRYVKFQENLFSNSETKSIFLPSTFSQMTYNIFLFLDDDIYWGGKTGNGRPVPSCIVEL